MKVSIKITGIDYYTGNKRSFTIHTQYQGIFETTTRKNTLIADHPKLIELMGENITTTAFEKADAWFSDEPKHSILIEYDLSAILDWTIIKLDGQLEFAKEKFVADERLSMFKNVTANDNDLLKMIDHNIDDASMKLDMIATYISMRDSIKSLKYKKQFSILLDAVSVAYKSSSATLGKLKIFRDKLDAIPKDTWKAAQRQDNMSTKQFLKQHLECDDKKVVPKRVPR